MNEASKPTPENAIFVWIPKTAGTSVFAALQNGARFAKLKRVRDVVMLFKQSGRVTFGHMNCLMLVAGGLVERRYFDRAFKFAFVRDPYSRAVSLYQYLKKERRLPVSTTFLQFCQRLENGRLEPVGLYNSSGLSQCNPQQRWIEGLALDFLGRYEELDAGFNYLAGQFGMTASQLPYLNSSVSAAAGAFYCLESKRIIETFYAEDFAAFGYPFRALEDLTAIAASA